MSVQVNRIFIHAKPQQVWDAITSSEFNDKYGFRCVSEYDLKVGGAFRALASKEMAAHGAPEVIIDGEVLECDPPHRLKQTWHAMFSPEIAAEAVTTLTWELAEQFGATRLTVTHETPDAPLTAAMTSGNVENAGGGWPHLLSDLKTYLETGAPMGG
ncbi:SRPBCC family protein [Kutzneria sp. CA-103260]|uniref:SRPBCC family protein n=1 Tax=Kutzneria sp. CA-103260 TaxID=2802641 RepID=UPI001BABF5B3|nr:SRPBCC family protein [Kutzneria sp. CA-103260]QUQ72286.1 activator of Hsp90 ATPase [Kutzneria sp. CA-103260]